MKTTIDINDELLIRAKRNAKKTGRSLRSVVEEGLRKELSAQLPTKKSYKLNPNLCTGDPSDSSPLENLSWEEIREMIYEDWRRS